MNQFKKVAFYTLGCKLNFSETSTLSRLFEEGGYAKVDFDEHPDIFIINTCSVTDNADKKCKQLDGLDFKEGMKVLNTYVRENGEFIPPLVNIYMHLSPSMKTFGTAVNPDFGNVEETGILITIADIFEEKKERHMVY